MGLRKFDEYTILANLIILTRGKFWMVKFVSQNFAPYYVHVERNGTVH